MNAKRIAKNCRDLIKNQNIKLEISHEFLNDPELHDFLAGNSMNVFMYEDTGGRGLSSTVDNALAVNRAVAVSNCPMFRHILNISPSICVDDLSLKKILDNGADALNKISKDWNKENLLWEYERIINTIFQGLQQPAPGKKGVLKAIRSSWKRFFSLPGQSFTWLRNTKAASEDNL